MYLKIKNFAKKLYFKTINVLHYPFVKKGADDPYHKIFEEFIDLVDQTPSASMLEIGSRNVTGVTYRGRFENCEDYTGFDIVSGEGVDIVGDIHKLSESFPSKQFDFIFAISVFEHLLFPWKAVLEINQITKPEGYVFLSTHPVWAEHEMPWDFWRFPKNGFHALFNEFTGFEIVSLTEGLPCNTYSLVDDPPTRYNFLGTTNQGVALIARKTGGYRNDLLKWDIDVADVIKTMYPTP